MRKIKKIHQATYAPIANLVTYRAIPTQSIEYIDPFLFLNHHGLQEYGQNNTGLPFGPHPHRGFETVTFIIEGDIKHKDSGGFESVIGAGGIQWITAGKGLIHEEVSSEKFKQEGGTLEILQLWVNLPAKYKMVEPKYKGVQKEDIPSVFNEDKTVVINVVSGKWSGVKAKIDTLTEISLATLEMKIKGKYTVNIPVENNVFFYVVRGVVTVNGTEAKMHNLVEFDNNDEELNIEAISETILLLGHAKPFKEPVAAQGPFVMNTQEEIMQAYQDYQAGEFGTWNE